MCVNDTRTFVMAILATIWGIRLSYNFSRRGGYTFPPWRGEEDYRWPLIRSGKLPGFAMMANPYIFNLFNLVFVSFYQNILLLLIVTPSIVANRASTTCGTGEFNTLDIIATFCFIISVFLETVADDQQYNFQTQKLINSKSPLTGEFKVGYRQTGLYSIVRKPNYFFEQANWVIFYLFTVSSTGSWCNISGLGFILLLGLFQGSGKMTEDITERKYKSYKNYRARVGLYNPFYTLWQKLKAD